MMLPAHRVIIAVYTLLHEGYAVQLRNNGAEQHWKS